MRTYWFILEIISFRNWINTFSVFGIRLPSDQNQSECIHFYPFALISHSKQTSTQKNVRVVTYRFGVRILSFRFVCCTPPSASRCSCINKLLKIGNESSDDQRHCMPNRFILCGIRKFGRLQAEMRAFSSPWQKHSQRRYARAATKGNETSNGTM